MLDCGVREHDHPKMDLIERIARQFDENSRASHDALEMLAAPIAGAVEVITHCLLDNGRIITCGKDDSAPIARRIAAKLVHGFELERPPLAAVALDNVGMAPSAATNDHAETLARQIRAIGQPGDVLLAIFAGDTDTPSIVEAVSAAHEREMHVVALTGPADGGIGQLLAATDIHICVSAERAARIHELHVLIAHCLCDGIDCLLLGVQD